MERCVEQWRAAGDEHRELQAMRIVAWCSDELEIMSATGLHEEVVRRARLIGDI